MKKERVFYKTIQIATLSIVLVVIYVTWEVISFSITKIMAASPNVFAPLIGAIATISGAIAAVIITQQQTKQRERDEAHRNKKTEIYAEFVKTITQISIAMKNKDLTINEFSKNEFSDQKSIEYFFKYKADILLWGSPKVIKAQLEFQAISQSGGDVFKAVDNIYSAIRDDIGLSNKGLNSLDLVKLFLTDPGELDKIRH